MLVTISPRSLNGENAIITRNGTNSNFKGTNKYSIEVISKNDGSSEDETD
jgi:hypothetical protein